MPVNYATPAADQLFPVAGVRLGVAEAEIRKKNRRDLTLVALDGGPSQWSDKCSEAIAKIGVKALPALQEKLLSKEPRERL